MNAVPAIGDNNKSFMLSDNQTFDELQEKLLKKLLQWKNLINEEKVESDVVGFPVSAKWWEVLANVTTHNAYHIGQIIYIRKLQQSFDNE